MNKTNLIDRVGRDITKHLVDRGKLLEAGWVAFAHLTKTNPILADGLRVAFLAGAEHAFSSMFSFIEEGDDATENDMRRMAMLQAEIDKIRAELAQRLMPVKGSG